MRVKNLQKFLRFNSEFLLKIKAYIFKLGAVCTIHCSLSKVDSFSGASVSELAILPVSLHQKSKMQSTLSIFSKIFSSFRNI